MLAITCRVPGMTLSGLFIRFFGILWLGAHNMKTIFTHNTFSQAVRLRFQNFLTVILPKPAKTFSDIFVNARVTEPTI